MKYLQKFGVFVALAFSIICIPASLKAQAYLPPGYSSASIDSSWSASLGYSQIGDDFYLTFKPLIEIPIGKFKIGLELPIRVLVADDDNSTGEEIPSLDKGLYDTYEDLQRLLVYVKYGTHLYFDPDDAFNWSFHYGKMTDGYLGHKTIVYRYINNYDDDVYRAGLMADINTNWGGIEHFSSDMYNSEVVGWRGYIRPWGIVTGVRNLFFAGAKMPSLNQVALSVYNRGRRQNFGVFYQEKIPEHGKNGRLGQHFLPKMKDVLDNNPVKFREVRDPATGETVIEPVPEDTRTPAQRFLDKKNEKNKGGNSRQNNGAQNINKNRNKDIPEESSVWNNGFLNRFAIGYSVVDDKNAPLNLEADGSGNIVIDPILQRPRADDEENLRFIGYDVEFRLSPFRWLDVTPYVDINRIDEIDQSKATHIGLDTRFTLGTLKISFRPEYRELSSNYLPTYFDSTHVIERTIYNPGGTGSSTTGASSSNVTKLSYLKSLPEDGEMKKGYFVQFVFDWTELLVIEATYEDYDGLDNSVVFTGIYVPGFFDFYLNGYYTKKNFDKFEEAYEYDDRSIAVAQMGYNLFAGISLSISFQRTWEYNATTSTFEPVDEKSYNIGFSSSF